MFVFVHTRLSEQVNIFLFVGALACTTVRVCMFERVRACTVEAPDVLTSSSVISLDCKITANEISNNRFATIP